MAITDYFESFSPSVTGPATGGIDISPDDNIDLSAVPRAIMVTGEGDVDVVFKDGSQMVLPGLLPGVIYPVRISRVLTGGTTATGIKGLL